MNLARMRKAVMAIVGAGVAVLAVWGLEVPDELSTAVVTLVTAVLVYLVPNAAKA